MAVFTYKAFQTDGKTAEGQIEAGGRQEAFRQMEEKGLRPITLPEKGTAAGEKNRRKQAGGRILPQVPIQKSHAANAGEFHAASFQPFGGRCAVEPSAGDPL